MTLEEYQKQTADTVIYSHDIRMYYSVLGLIGEVGEFDEKVSNEEILQELGDIMWYCSQICNEYELRLKQIIGPPLTLFRLTAKVAELVKKYFRDKKEIKQELEDLIGRIVNQVHILAKTTKRTVEQVMDMNIKKLQDRKDRNVLHGEGDNR